VRRASLPDGSNKQIADDLDSESRRRGTPRQPSGKKLQCQHGEPISLKSALGQAAPAKSLVAASPAAHLQIHACAKRAFYLEDQEDDDSQLTGRQKQCPEIRADGPAACRIKARGIEPTLAIIPVGERSGEPDLRQAQVNDSSEDGLTGQPRRTRTA